MRPLWRRRRGLADAAAGFETATTRLQEAASQRKEVMRGFTDVLWQLKRNIRRRLEARLTMSELEKMKDAIERQKAAEVLVGAAKIHAAELKKAQDEAREASSGRILPKPAQDASEAPMRPRLWAVVLARRLQH